MDTSIKQEGFLVFQEAPCADGSVFRSTKEAAKEAAIEMLQTGPAVVVVPAVRFTGSEESDRPDSGDVVPASQLRANRCSSDQSDAVYSCEPRRS
jgi:hypothetical protein